MGGFVLFNGGVPLDPPRDGAAQMSPSPAATPEWQMTTRARKSFIGLIVGAVIVLLAGSVWMTYDEQIRQDPGLRACGSLARRASVELSEPEYRRLQAMFARSTKASLREHGVRAIEAGLILPRPVHGGGGPPLQRGGGGPARGVCVRGRTAALRLYMVSSVDSSASSLMSRAGALTDASGRCSRSMTTRPVRAWRCRPSRWATGPRAWPAC